MMINLFTKLKQIYPGRNSILRKWLLSYFIVLIIPLIASVFVYFRTYSIVTQEVLSSNSVTLKALQAALDYRLKQAKELSSSILLDKRFRDVTLVNNTRQMIVERQGALMSLISNYCSITTSTDIFIYIPDLDYCITTTTANSLPHLYDALQFGKTYPAFDLDRWRFELGYSKNNSSYVSSSMLSYNKFGRDSIVYCAYSNPLFIQSGHQSCVFVSLQISEIDSIVSSQTSSNILILSRDGKIIKNFGNAMDDFEFVLENADGGYQIVQNVSGKYVCSYILSTASDFIYAVVTPYQLFWSKTSYMMTVMVIALFSASFLGILLSIYLLYRNYTPLQNTLRKLKYSGDTKRNEFELINEQLESLYNKQTSMQSDFSRQQAYLKKNYIHSLLQGSNWSLIDNDMLEVLRSDFIGKVLVPVNVYIENERDFGLFGESEIGGEVSVPFIIGNVLDEILQFKYEYIKTSTNTTVTFVFILTPEQQKNFEVEIVGSLEWLCTFLGDNLNLSLYTVIGTHTSDIEHLADINKGMNLAHSYQDVSVNNRVVRAEEFFGIPGAVELCLDSYAAPLYEAIQILAYHDAIKITDSLFVEFGKLDEPFTSVRFYLFSLVNKLQLSSAAKKRKDSRFKLLSLMDSLTDCENLAALKRVFTDILAVLCFDSETVPSKTEGRIYLRIEKYVLANYDNISLNLSQIADHIGLSAKYISKLFKMETGEGLPDYINTVRIQKAKEIMQQEQPTINELAYKVGYSNVKTFRRTFQKIEKINPGQYKVMSSVLEDSHSEE